MHTRRKGEEEGIHGKFEERTRGEFHGDILLQERLPPSCSSGSSLASSSSSPSSPPPPSFVSFSISFPTSTSSSSSSSFSWLLDVEKLKGNELTREEGSNC